MARVFVSSSRDGSEIESLLIDGLKSQHQIIRMNDELGSQWKASIRGAFQRADVFVAILTKDFLSSKNSFEGLTYLISYIENNKQKLLIPVVVGEIELPFDLQQFVYIRIDPGDIASIEIAVESINKAIARHAGRIAATQEIESDKKQKIESKAAEYVEEAIKELKGREGILLKKAGFWYWMGYGAIAIGVLAAGVFAFIGYARFQQPSPAWDLVAFAGIKSIVLVGLLLAMAKYSFSLAKSYMEESLKNADRIHAISFGKFYLQAFGNEAQQTDIKEIFQHWNISGKNSFSAQNANSIEPKMLETAFELAKAMSSNTKNH